MRSDWWISIRFALHGLLVVLVIMIVGSKKRNRLSGFK